MKFSLAARLFTLSFLAACSSQTQQITQPSQTPSTATLPPHTVSRSDLAGGSRIQLDTNNASLNHDECSALIEAYIQEAGAKGQVVVQKPGSQKTWKGALLPFCVNNLDGKGTAFNDFYFLPETTAAKPSPTLSSEVKPINVQLKITATKVTPKKVLVNGLTNLPDGFVFTVSACRYHIEKSDNKKHCFERANPLEQYPSVSKGKFATTFIVPTMLELKASLNNYASDIQELSLTQSQINNFVTIEIVGTPRKQDDKILGLLGGKDAPALRGKQVETTHGFNVVSFRSNVKM